MNRSAIRWTAPLTGDQPGEQTGKRPDAGFLGELMADIPVTGTLGEYHGKRCRILFGGDDWVALPAEPDVDMPDAIERGESRVGPERYEQWAKLPMSALDGIIDTVVSATLAGHTVSVDEQMPDGAISVSFIGPPAVAREIGLQGDQYIGWTGLVAPDELTDIRVEETRRA